MINNSQSTYTQLSFTGRTVSEVLLRQIKKLINHSRKNIKILDIGCGDGSHLIDISRNINNLSVKAKISAIDISKRNIELASERLGDINFIVADAINLPFESNYFDFVYSWMVIEHLNDYPKMVSEINRVLKENGTCYVSTIMKSPRAIYFYKVNGKFALDPTHVHEFESQEEFVKLFRDAGFRVFESYKFPKKYALIELIIKVLLKSKLMTPALKNRNFYDQFPIFQKIRNLFNLPIPGFYQLELVAKKY